MNNIARSLNNIGSYNEEHYYKRRAYCLLLQGYRWLAIFWLASHPPEIIAIHKGSSGFSAVLVKNFPFPIL